MALYDGYPDDAMAWKELLHKNSAKAWYTCERAEWLMAGAADLWFNRRVLVRIACRIARETPLADGVLLWDFIQDKEAVYAAERWANGTASHKEVHAAYLHTWEVWRGTIAHSARESAAYAALCCVQLADEICMIPNLVAVCVVSQALACAKCYWNETHIVHAALPVLARVPIHADVPFMDISATQVRDAYQSAERALCAIIRDGIANANTVR